MSSSNIKKKHVCGAAKSVDNFGQHRRDRQTEERAYKGEWPQGWRIPTRIEQTGMVGKEEVRELGSDGAGWDRGKVIRFRLAGRGEQVVLKPGAWKPIPSTRNPSAIANRGR